MDLDGRKALVVGLARTGVAAARFLLERRARVRVTDLRGAEELGEVAGMLTEAGCTVILGEHRREDFLDADLIVLSPGVPLTLSPLQEACRAGIEVIGEVELAFRHIECPVIGVTGTNGKSTTVSMIHAMLEKAAIPHWTGGNIGRPLADFLLSRPSGEDVAVPEVVLAELSSFQLETTVNFRPRFAVWTNLSEDHLDRYPSMEAYAEAKARIFLNQTEQDDAIIPDRDPWLESQKARIRARVLRFGCRTEHVPELWIEKGQICFRLKAGGETELYETARVKVPGRHNLENLMAALAVARLCGAPPACLQAAMDTFEGLEHRVEFAGEHEGVRFYNDSKATTVDSVCRALECFDQPVLLLAGGKDKGGTYLPLREPLKRHVRKLVLFGEAAARMERELTGATEILRTGDMEAAVRTAWRAAKPGEIILLSPACSSFDQFTNYEERGKRFKGLIDEITHTMKP